MNLHQVLTGAVNPGDHCFSVGSVGDQRFTAYASGCDIVILGSDFERLQIIPGAKHGNIQIGCVDCSMQQGKIAASYGNVISVFEPVILPKQKKNLIYYTTYFLSIPDYKPFLGIYLNSNVFMPLFIFLYWNINSL